MGAPEFNSDQPSTIDYLDDYTQKTEGLHALAQNLMQIIDPQVQEQVIDLHAATQSTQSAPQAASVQAEDPTVALPKYKALLDAGVITAEEFRSEEETEKFGTVNLILQEYGLEKTDEKDITENRTAGSDSAAACSCRSEVTFGGILRRRSKIHL